MSFADPNDVDEKQNRDSSEEHGATDDANDPDGDRVDRTRDTVELAWVPEDQESEMPLAEAVKANGEVLRGVPTEFDLKDLRGTVDSIRENLRDLQEQNQQLRNENQRLRDENEQLRDRVESLEQWKGQTVEKINELNRFISKLRTASDLDERGLCPKCQSGTLEKITGFGQTNRIECTGENCGHIAAELE